MRVCHSVVAWKDWWPDHSPSWRRAAIGGRAGLAALLSSIKKGTLTFVLSSLLFTATVLEGLFGEYHSEALGQEHGTRWPLTPLRCTFSALRWTFPALRWTFPALRCSDNAGNSLPKSFIVIVFTPCTNFPFPFRAKRQLILYSTSEVTNQSWTNKWLLGDFWTLLAQCCWWGLVFSVKVFQHSGSKQ